MVISTNSLAATDAFIVYALSHKYKRRYLREFGFTIHEYKPFPLDAPIDVAATGAAMPASVPADTPLPTRPRHPQGSAVEGARYRALSREYAALRYARRPQAVLVH